MAALSKTVEGFQPSPISEIFSLCNRLKEAGRDIVDLSIGEPDFDTPPAAKEAGIAAITAGDSKYTSTDGTTQLIIEADAAAEAYDGWLAAAAFARDRGQGGIGRLSRMRQYPARNALFRFGK